jgi:hypothetical protein
MGESKQKPMNESGMMTAPKLKPMNSVTTAPKTDGVSTEPCMQGQNAVDCSESLNKQIGAIKDMLLKF